MRTTLLAGVSLAVTAVVVLSLSAALDLELEAFALVGLACGTVVAQAAGRASLGALAGFVGGAAVAWCAYLLRTDYLPRTDAGLTVGVAGALLVAAVLSAATRARLPLWSVVLGLGALAGCYEVTFVDAPDDFARTSLTALSSLLLTAAAGYAAGSLLMSSQDRPDGSRVGPGRGDDAGDEHDDLDVVLDRPLTIADLLTDSDRTTTEAFR